MAFEKILYRGIASQLSSLDFQIVCTRYALIEYFRPAKFSPQQVHPGITTSANPKHGKRTYATPKTYITFGIEVWGSANKALLDRICIMQKPIIRCIGAARYLEPSLLILKRLHILKVDELFKLYILKQDASLLQNESPKPNTKNEQVHPYEARHRSNPPHKGQIEYYLYNFFVGGA